MLYTGGTTGMPKGVMYTHGVFPIALAGFGAAITGAGAPPTNGEELLALGDQLDRAAGVARGVPADARHRHVAGHDGAAADEGHGRHAHEPLVRRARAAGRRSSARA